MASLQAACGAVAAVRGPHVYEGRRCAVEASSGDAALGRTNFRLGVFRTQWRANGMDVRLAVGSVSPRSKGLRSRARGGSAVAVFGGGENPEKKKFITREEEPEEFWSSEGEQAGKNPLASPLAWIGILGIFFPFILLGIAFAAGLVKLP